MMRVLVGAALAAVVMMLWGAVYWVVLWGPGAPMKPLPDEGRWMEQMRGGEGGSALPGGAYLFPFQPAKVDGHSEAMKTYLQREMQGPLGMLFIRPAGRTAMGGDTLLLGLAHFFVSALMAAILLRMVMSVLTGYLGRVFFVFLLGVFAALTVRLSDPIWWNLPWDFFVHGAVMTVINWLLAGLVLAMIVKPQQGFVHETDPNRPLWKRALDVD